MILAALTSFVGRGESMDEAWRLLKVARLTTVVGPGGVGKTRMALELVRRVEADYDAVAIADLAEHSGAEAVEHWLVSTLDLGAHPGQLAHDRLIEYLRDKRVLLVLDNCEHVWEAAGDVVSALLADAPELTVIATSRRPLEIAGEHVLRVAPLAIPPPGADREQAALSDAVVLLLDRARAAGRPIADDHYCDTVLDLVRWSGGLPLVLELIAARLGGGLSPDTIMQRLDGGRLLKGVGRGVSPRHRALWDVLEWSYRVCSAGEQRLWARLSVFSGGFDLAMAEQVCGDPDGIVATPLVVDLLTGLVRQSVLIADSAGRFRQLPPMREYGLRQLQAFGEEEMTRERHCALMARLAAEAVERPYGPSGLTTFHQVRREIPNIRSALSFCDSPERAGTGLRIAADITQLGFSFFAAFLDEMCAWLEIFLTRMTPAPSPDRVDALAMLTLMRLWQGDQDRADTHRQECLDQARRLEATADDLPIVSFMEGMHLFLAHSDSGCLAPLTQACDAFDAKNARAAAFRARIWLAVAAGFLAPGHIADQAAAECLNDAQAHGGAWSISWALWAQGRASHADPDLAIPLLQQALQLMIDMGDQPMGANMCVEAIAWEWAAQGHALPAAKLLGAVAGIQQSTGVVIRGPGPFQREREHSVSRIRATLGGEACTGALHEGNKLRAAEIYTLALSDINRPPGCQSDHLPGAPVTLDALTRRQQQIAQLIAQGLSNRQIAKELNISQRTVENHLAQIFVRLDVHNRAQVAAWTTTQT
ncbi:NB-ARC domain-containing protein [Actinoallomurus vinaceus]|uniref:NB-ARC domain-containing protein n=2 Tax=Actinoallomurus vinaceus TaxID=1080074 RepID=A0ABP8UE72_9ACTN